MKTIKAIIGLTVILGMWALICKYPFIFFGTILTYGALLYWVNSIYRKATGKDMKVYTKLMNS